MFHGTNDKILIKKETVGFGQGVTVSKANESYTSMVQVHYNRKTTGWRICAKETRPFSGVVRCAVCAAAPEMELNDNTPGGSKVPQHGTPWA